MALKYVKRGYHVLCTHALTLLLLPVAVTTTVSPTESVQQEGPSECSGTARADRCSPGPLVTQVMQQQFQHDIRRPAHLLGVSSVVLA